MAKVLNLESISDDAKAHWVLIRNDIFNKDNEVMCVHQKIAVIERTLDCSHKNLV